MTTRYLENRRARSILAAVGARTDYGLVDMLAEFLRGSLSRSEEIDLFQGLADVPGRLGRMGAFYERHARALTAAGLITYNEEN